MFLETGAGKPGFFARSFATHDEMLGGVRRERLAAFLPLTYRMGGYRGFIR